MRTHEGNEPAVLVAAAIAVIAAIAVGYIDQLDPANLPSLESMLVVVQEQVRNNKLFLYGILLSIPITLLFERIAPAKPEQRIWNSGVKQDMIWFFVAKGFRATVVVGYIALLGALYQRYLAGLTIDSLSDLSAPMRWLIGILFIDFLQWFHHLVRHKVPLFWHFHAVHHSQRQLNLFTDFRIHVVEFLIAETLIFVPLFMLSFDVPEVIAYTIFLSFYTRFYHGNIRVNLGPLRYVLVTPQSHRIHHSSASEHKDTNFGLIFCVWDRAFGTHCDDGTYPDTGIADESFPHPRNDSLSESCRSLVRQFLYPFRKILSGAAR